MADLVITERIHDIAILTLNRPDKRNALSPELVQALKIAVDGIAEDESVRAVILTGAGKAFCAGADLAYLQKLSQFSEKQNLEDSRGLSELFEKMYRLPKLTIAMANGPALAGGCGLAMCCDYIMADRNNSRFGFTEVRIGFIPAIVMNFLIRKIPLNAAFHLAVSGEILSAADALKAGIINEIIEEKELRERTLQFAENMLNQNSISAMIQTKQLFQHLLDVPLQEGLELAASANVMSRKTEDCQRGLKAFLNKEKIRWRE